MLTKEECREALKILSTQPDESFCNGSICGVSDCGYCPKNTASKLLKHLIDDHFSNPPLKFKELIKHKVIWDNELKEYAFVLEQYKPTILNVHAPSDLQAISLEYRGGEIECLLSEEVAETINDYYVPNRFYRKEVQE